jgi:hypothetical protein
MYRRINRLSDKPAISCHEMCQPSLINRSIICNPRAARRLEIVRLSRSDRGLVRPDQLLDIYIESTRLDPRLVVIPFCSSEQVHMSIAIVT